jgi:hypothetical protein
LGDPKPSWLLDEDERMNAARQGPNLNTVAISKEQDRRRKIKQKAKDDALQAAHDINFQKGVAEATLRQHGIR